MLTTRNKTYRTTTTTASTPTPQFTFEQFFFYFDSASQRAASKARKSLEALSVSKHELSLRQLSVCFFCRIVFFTTGRQVFVKFPIFEFCLFLRLWGFSCWTPALHMSVGIQSSRRTFWITKESCQSFLPINCVIHYTGAEWPFESSKHCSAIKEQLLARFRFIALQKTPVGVPQVGATQWNSISFPEQLFATVNYSS